MNSQGCVRRYAVASSAAHAPRGDGTEPVVDAELGVDALCVFVHRPLTDLQLMDLPGDLEQPA